MRCRQARRRLGDDIADGAVRRHVESCAACDRFARRLAATRETLAAHRSIVSPPPSFAARVTARLPRDEDFVGWAALRLLPATLALVLLLSWLNLRQPATATVESSPAEVVLGWVLDPAAEVGGDS